METGYEIAVYYFPNYHVDPQNVLWHGEGWTEWELMKAARPRFAGHQQPKVPLWGYEDESNPHVMAKKIAAASQSGITSFIFDWYWHEEGPYLERALDEGFLQAPNNSELKFSLMWANHDWVEIHPAGRKVASTLRRSGPVSERAFIDATDHVIRRYFQHPSYWRVMGGLYFSFYDLPSLVKGLGGVEQTRAALNGFRERTRAAGLGEIHMNAVVWNVGILPNESVDGGSSSLLFQLGFDSGTSYVWIHHCSIPQFPATKYAEYRDMALTDYNRLDAETRLPYFPNVTVGWDPSPRTIQTDVYDNIGYPFTPTLTENTPEEFKMALQKAKQFVDGRIHTPKIITINAWNEWTEGSYLEPDLIHGMGYLEAIKDVFLVGRTEEKLG